MDQNFIAMFTGPARSGRLDHLLRGWGIATKDETHAMAHAGRIRVNGILCTEGGYHCPMDPEIVIDGIPVQTRPFVTVMLNKPAGYVCMKNDTRYPDVCSLIHDIPGAHTLFCIGRLDSDTEGLLLLTNNGELSTRIAHPALSISKTYYVTMDRPLCPDAAEQMQAGILAPGGQRYRPAVLETLGPQTARITVTEGKYHEVKRLVRACGPYVTALRREAIGCLQLDPDLHPGEYRLLKEGELAAVFTPPASLSILSPE